MWTTLEIGKAAEVNFFNMKSCEGIVVLAFISLFSFMLSQNGTFGQPILHQVSPTVIVLVEPVASGIWRLLPFLKETIEC